jgi:flagellar basal-body rod modification protein FlgD
MSSTSIIDGINNANQAAAKSSSSSASSAASVQDMQDRFMTLFLAQLQHQDPLNPMDNAETTSQLAQMNMVSGIQSLNSTLQTLLGSYNDALSLQAANLIGKNVLVPGDNLALGSNGGVFGLDLAGAADKVEVSILDGSGKEVAHESLGQLDAGTYSFAWDGTDSTGGTAAAGNYTFAVSASLSGKAVNATALQAGTVSALTRAGSGTQVEVAGLGNVGLADVKQVF